MLQEEIIPSQQFKRGAPIEKTVHRALSNIWRPCVQLAVLYSLIHCVSAGGEYPQQSLCDLLPCWLKPFQSEGVLSVSQMKITHTHYEMSNYAQSLVWHSRHWWFEESFIKPSLEKIQTMQSFNYKCIHNLLAKVNDVSMSLCYNFHPHYKPVFYTPQNSAVWTRSPEWMNLKTQAGCFSLEGENNGIHSAASLLDSLS